MTQRPQLSGLMAAVVAAAALGGCGTQTLLAGLLIGLPQVSFRPTSPVPGVVLDPQNFGPYTILTGAVFTIDTSDPTKIQDAKVTGVAGVNATIIYRSCAAFADTDAAKATCLGAGTGGLDRMFPVPDKGSGIYALFNGDTPPNQPQLTYEPGVRYTFVMQVPSPGSKKDASGVPADFEAFGAGFKPGPRASIVEFKQQKQTLNPMVISKGTSITINRDDARDANGEYQPAFILVGQVDVNNPASQPTITYTSLNYQDPKELLKLALSDRPYRIGQFVIPGSAFPTTGYFVVAMLAVTEGKASANAFIGSTALSGSGDAGLVHAQ